MRTTISMIFLVITLIPMLALAQDESMPIAIGTYGPWTLSISSFENFEYCELSNANFISISDIDGTESSLLFLFDNKNRAEFVLHLKSKTVFPRHVSALLAFSNGGVLKVPMRFYEDGFIYDFQSKYINYHLFLNLDLSQELQVTIPNDVTPFFHPAISRVLD